MLSAQHISFQIGKKILLDNIYVDFHPSKINLIIGPNGAGKSTLIKVLSGMTKPTSGKVFYSKKNIREIPVQELAKYRAVLSQNIDLTFPLSVSEVVMMGRYPYFSGKPSLKDKNICDETIHFFDLEKLADRNYMTLSGGEKQRVHFARVTAQIWEPSQNDCHYLILDEPLTFLDVYYQFDFMNKITALIKQHNWVVVGVVHDLNLAGKYADKITLMNQGKVVADGDKVAVLNRDNIFSTYNLDTTIVHENGAVRLHF